MSSSFCIEVFSSRVVRFGGKLLCIVNASHELLYSELFAGDVLFANDHWVVFGNSLISTTDEKERYPIKSPPDRVLDVNDTAIRYVGGVHNFKTKESRKLSSEWTLTVTGYAAYTDKELLDLSTMKSRPLPKLVPPELKQTHRVLNPEGHMLVTVESPLRTTHVLHTGTTETLSHAPTRVSHKGFHVGDNRYTYKGKWQTTVDPIEKETAWKASDESAFVLRVSHANKASRWCIMNTTLV